MALLARRSVTWLAWQRASDAQADLGALAQHPGGAEVARVIAYALAGSSVTVTQQQFDDAIAQLTVSGSLPGEWTETRLRIGFLNRVGGWPLAVTAVDLGEQRAQVLLRRVDVLAVVSLLLLVGGLLVALAALVRRRAVFPRLADGIVLAPWLLSDGYAVVVRSLLLGLLLLIGLTIPLEILGGGEVPLGGVWLWLPAMVACTRRLLRPRGLALAPTFGMRSRGRLDRGRSPAAWRWWRWSKACAPWSRSGSNSWGGRPPGPTGATNRCSTPALWAWRRCWSKGSWRRRCSRRSCFAGVVYTSLRTRLGPWASAVFSAGCSAWCTAIPRRPRWSLFVARSPRP